MLNGGGCKHECVNSHGSYRSASYYIGKQPIKELPIRLVTILKLIVPHFFRCRCPPEYRLGEDGRTCEQKLEGCKVSVRELNLTHSAIYFSEYQETLSIAIQIGNGGCEHECYDQPDGGVVCACKEGFQLSPDRRTCRGRTLLNCYVR